ncbi:hypothetical protein NQD34_014653 [Periophthalmus magnuspinnatus]|nr:hypothetical protein NQD34_014653 [Periophthalmus magnuspinnatus]
METSNSNRTGTGEDAQPQSRQRPLSDMDLCGESVRHCRWSTDFGKSSTSAFIIVKKSKKEPEPPKRSVSLLRPQSVVRSTSKCHSCPTFGINPQIVSPSPSNISTCSSAPLIQTSMITGPDPLGWKLRRIPGKTSLQSRAGRLSLQIPLSDIYPVQECQMSTNSYFLKPKGAGIVRRHNSDSLAFFRSSETTLPVTKELLVATKLRHANTMASSDGVFEEKTKKIIKKPPPVPVKSETTIQIAKLLAFSQERSNYSDYEQHSSSKNPNDH